MRFLVVFSCIAYLAGQTAGYSGGPPPDACADMKPGPPHLPNSLSAAEQRQPPFEIVATKQGKSQAKVFLRSVKEVPFRGFMVMAEIDGQRGHGYFVPAPESEDLVGSLDCADQPSQCPVDDACQGKANAATHNSNDDKESITLVWTAPSYFNGKVTFVGTFVGENSDASTFWENVRSAPLNM